MNRKTYWSVLCVIFIMALAACGGNGTKIPPPVEMITVTSGSGQSAVVSTAFANPLVATVSTGGVPNAGVAVTFTAPGSGASGTFNSGSATAMVTTDANGVATSPAFTANSTAGGPYIVTAAAAGVSANVNFTLTNTAAAVASSQFTFYVSGENLDDGFEDFYAIGGTVVIDANGNVEGGEQDFNDGDLIHSPTTGDTITGGSLVEDTATGLGTLTVITNNSAVGVNGTETFGIQFVNPSHALLIAFDESATSSGSLDLQTLPSPLAAPNGNFAFSLTGVDPNFNSVVVGGVFTVSGAGSGNLTSGLFDYNDAGDVVTGTPFTGTMSAPDGFGRGTIINTDIATTVAYYIVGPGAIRLLDVDSALVSGSEGTGSLSGSAFGQGSSAGEFDNSSLTASVFNLESNDYGFPYVAVGEFSTSAAPAVKATPKPQGLPPVADFNGYGDDNEDGSPVAAIPISGTYGIQTNGYGSMTFTTDLQDVTFLGVYLVDPNINIQDPNNSTGTGGALLVELDGLVGTGIAIPQTVTSTAAITGNYVYGAQVFETDDGEEADLIGQAAISSGVLSGTGLLNDPFDVTGLGVGDDIDVNGTAIPDTTSGATGRYTMFATPLTVVETNSGGTFVFDSVVIYQANGGQLFSMNGDNEDLDTTLFGGPLQQQGSAPIIPVPAKKSAVKLNLKLKSK